MDTNSKLNDQERSILQHGIPKDTSGAGTPYKLPKLRSKMGAISRGPKVVLRKTTKREEVYFTL